MIKSIIFGAISETIAKHVSLIEALGSAGAASEGNQFI
jgi:hypothetical protein